MTVYASIRSGVVSGVRSGMSPSHSSSWTLDATSGLALPVDGTEANALLTAAGVTGSTIALYTFQEASGAIDDKVGALDLTAAGTLAYQQAITGWAAKGVKTTRATPGTMLNTGFGDVASTAATIYMLAQIDAVAADATLTLFRYGTTFDDDATMEMKITLGGLAKLTVGEGDATRTDGTVDMAGGVHMFALSCGASIAGYSDLEKVIGGTRACNGTEICLGGDNNNTWFPGDVRYMRAFVVNATHSAAQVKAVMQAAGWTISWS